MSKTFTDSSAADLTPERPATKRQPGVAIWLGVLCALVVAMILVGGLTRLTDSGLSITEWKPVTGAIPPLTHEAWEEELEKYRQIPEYQLINRGMSLGEFQAIYWWEWGHRFLGRAIGFVFAIPFVFFLFTGRIGRSLGWRLGVIFILGGLQGAVGWWMVSSGLTERVDVSQYRLAAHLSLALVILVALFWILLDMLPVRRLHAGSAALWGEGILLAAVFLQIVSGAFVAGMDAGMVHNTWPLMDGGFRPEILRGGGASLADGLEDRSVAQFNHRIGAYLLLALITAGWLLLRGKIAERARLWLNALAVMAWAQGALGVATLLSVAALPLGIAHQAGAVALLLLATGLLHDSLGGGVGAKGLSGATSDRSR